MLRPLKTSLGLLLSGESCHLRFEEFEPDRGREPACGLTALELSAPVFWTLLCWRDDKDVVPELLPFLVFLAVLMCGEAYFEARRFPRKGLA